MAYSPPPTSTPFIRPQDLNPQATVKLRSAQNAVTVAAIAAAAAVVVRAAAAAQTVEPKKESAPIGKNSKTKSSANFMVFFLPLFPPAEPGVDEDGDEDDDDDGDD